MCIEDYPPTSMVWETCEDWYHPEDMILPDHYLWWDFVDEDEESGEEEAE